MRQKLTELYGETDNSAMIAGAFNTEEQTEKSITDLTDTYGTHYSKTKYTLFLSTKIHAPN